MRAAKALLPRLRVICDTWQLQQQSAASASCAWCRAACFQRGTAQPLRSLSTESSSSSSASSGSGSSSVFVVNVEGHRNVSPLLIGLFDFLERFVPRPGFFQVHKMYEGDGERTAAQGMQRIWRLLPATCRKRCCSGCLTPVQAVRDHYIPDTCLVPAGTSCACVAALLPSLCLSRFLCKPSFFNFTRSAWSACACCGNTMCLPTPSHVILLSQEALGGLSSLPAVSLRPSACVVRSPLQESPTQDQRRGCHGTWSSCARPST